MFASMRVRNFRLFVSGQAVKLIGVWMQFIAQDWLVLELTGDSASALGVVTALQFTPVLLLTLYGGTLADRYDKRRLLIATNVAFSALSLFLGLMVLTGTATLGWVYVFAACLGVANAVENPTRQAFASEMVPPELLPNALSLSSATFNLARVVGPALAGVAIAVVGIGPVFLINAVTYLAPTVTLLKMRAAELVLARRAPAGSSIFDGLRYVRGRDDLVLPLSVLLVVGMFGFNFQLLLSVLAKTVFQTGPASFGLLTTALGAGSIVGALAGSRRRARPGEQVVLGAAMGLGLLEILVATAPTFPLTAVVLVPTGFFMIYFAQATNQRVQLGTDAAYRGRVMSIWVLVFIGTTPAGAPAMGWISEHYGPRAALALGGMLSLTAALVALGWRLRRSGGRLRLAPLRGYLGADEVGPVVG